MAPANSPHKTSNKRDRINPPRKPAPSVAVVGAGAWGTTLATVLAKNGMNVSLWVYENELCDIMTRTRENTLYLPGILLHRRIKPCTDLAATVSGKTMIVFVTPSQVLRSVATQVAKVLPPAGDVIAVCCSKGIEKNTLMLPSEILEDTLGRRFVRGDAAFISGPSFAREVVTGQPTSVAVTAYDMRVAEHVHHAFETDTFTLYANPDVIGVQVCGAVKNVIAIAVGISTGLGYGHNTRAALITRGLGEIMKLGSALGADPLTFSGLAGFGDLVLTCTSDKSRNKTLGERLGQGEKLQHILNSAHTVAEGADTARSVRDLALKHSLDMPICNQVYKVLHEHSTVQTFVQEILALDKRHDVGRVRLT